MDEPRTLVLATRGSALALAQADRVGARAVAARPGLVVELLVVSTAPDRAPDRPLRDLGGDKGLFTREIDEAVLDGRAHAAVHSLKDLPAGPPPGGLRIAATPLRDDPRDALVSAWPGGLAGLPAGARVGTGSLRRAALLAAARPDLRVVEMRGNVDSRVARVGRGEFDAVVLAAAGLLRLGLAGRVSEFLDAAAFPPAAAQGILAVVAPGVEQPDPFADLWPALDDPAVAAAAAAERAFIEELGAGCHSAVAALATPGPDAFGPSAIRPDARLAFHGAVLAPDGSARLDTRRSGDAGSAADVGRAAAEDLLARGCGRYL